MKGGLGWIRVATPRAWVHERGRGSIGYSGIVVEAACIENRLYLTRNIIRRGCRKRRSAKKKRLGTGFCGGLLNKCEGGRARVEPGLGLRLVKVSQEGDKRQGHAGVGGLCRGLRAIAMAWGWDDGTPWHGDGMVVRPHTFHPFGFLTCDSPVSLWNAGYRGLTLTSRNRTRAPGRSSGSSYDLTLRPHPTT